MTRKEKIKALRAEFRELQRQHRHTLNGWRLVINNRLRTTGGRCHHRKLDIEIAGWSVDQNGMDVLSQTLRHEVAHALTPRHGHDNVWKAAAVMLGAEPRRCMTREASNKSKSEPKWRVDCARCGKIFYRRRRQSRWWEFFHHCGDGERGQLYWLDRRTGDVYQGDMPFTWNPIAAESGGD